MSLLTLAMEPCKRLDRITEDDGYGGEVTTWRAGASFDAAITYDSSMEARTAAVEGVTSLYTVTTRKDKLLSYHDVFTRLSDGKIFRVTSDGLDNKTPASAGLNMRQVSAEEFIPSGTFAVPMVPLTPATPTT